MNNPSFGQQILSQVGEQQEKKSDNSQKDANPKTINGPKVRKTRQLPDNSDDEETEQVTENLINLFAPMFREAKTKNQELSQKNDSLSNHSSQKIGIMIGKAIVKSLALLKIKATTFVTIN